MGKVVISKGVIICYLVSMLLTYLVVIRIDNINTNITTQDQSLVYNNNTTVNP